MDHAREDNLIDYQRRRRITLGIGIAFTAAVLIFVQSAHDEVTHERFEGFGMLLIAIGVAGRMWSTLYIGGHKAASLVQTSVGAWIPF